MFLMPMQSGICISNINELIFSRPNVRNKLDTLSELIKSSVLRFMISKTNLDDTLP